MGCRHVVSLSCLTACIHPLGKSFAYVAAMDLEVVNGYLVSRFEI